MRIIYILFFIIGIMGYYILSYVYKCPVVEGILGEIHLGKCCPKGYKFSQKSFENDFYLSIPLNKGQISCNEIINDVTLTSDIKKDDILSINHIDGPYNENKKLKARIEKRGYEKSKVINLETSINKIS